jgi:ribose-phosphate pyrophosphokinase
MNGLKIFSGNSNPGLAKSICNNLNTKLGNIELQRFPSGEEYCQFQENIRGVDVFLVQSISNPVNDKLMQLLLMCDAARRASAERITAVIPYFGYARQDRKDKPRVPISAKLLMDLLKAAGFSRILTMDLHAPQIGGFTNLPLDHLSFKPVLIEAVKCIGINCVVAPDIGSVKRADEYATALDTDLVIITKKRRSATSVFIKHFVGDVNHKNVIIIDDLTESAGTLIEAAMACKENGASEVYCAITHGCFTSIGMDRLIVAFLDKTINRLLYSNTVTSPTWEPDGIYSPGSPTYQQAINIVDVAPLFATAIKNIHNNQSVSSLFL